MPGSKSLIGVVLMTLAALPAFAKVDVLCVYYPHWHRYPKGDEWFGADRWKQGEWCFVKDARPLFPGHRQPIRPLAGHLDESDPADMAKDIALAANAGIDVFLYDYYYYGGQVTQEEALERGFLQAPNRNRMKFALMWCYHDRNDQFRPKIGAPRRRLMSLARTLEEFLGLIDLSIARYFKCPEYYRKDGKLFFSIYDACTFLDAVGESAAREALVRARERVRAAGLGEIHFNAQNAWRPKEIAAVEAAGFDSITHYGSGPWHKPGFGQAIKDGRGLVDYGWAVDGTKILWEKMKATRLPYIPNVAVGWDSSPRCRLDEPFPWDKNDYPYGHIITNNTPDRFEAFLRDARKYAKEDPRRPGIVYINGWNEYTEGTYLVPDNFDADGRLRAIAAVFGRNPKDEYTSINPSSRELQTVPSATYENAAYGTHPKQKADVWIPPGRSEPCPLLVYVHGGGWTAGALVDRIIGPKIGPLLQKGVAIACVGYRYLQETDRSPGEPPVKGCVDDVAAALAFLKANGRRWNLDVSRLGLSGGSAGACTAMILAYRDQNALGVSAVAPIIPQTSMDPVEMKEWIPNVRYGAHAFGYRDFDEWLVHRDDHPQWIAAYSPAELARRIDPSRAPTAIFRCGRPNAGVLPADPTHASAFVWKFVDICRSRHLPCDAATGGDVLMALAESLLKRLPVRNGEKECR